jgi:CheY-like chemotaxis protein
MDMQMPVLGGLDATRLIRAAEAAGQRTPIVAMTANAMDSDRDECLAAGMNAHVGKPFDLRALVQTLLDVSGYQPTTSEARSGPAPEAAPAANAANDVLDVAAALSRMGGLSALYARAARDFMQALPDQLLALRSAVGSDAARCKMLAHTLKGTSAMLGAVALSEAAAHLEKQCQGKDGAATSTATLQRLELLAQATVQQLQEAADGMDAPVRAPAAAAPAHTLRDDLQQLMALLAEDDFAALERFASLREALAVVPDALLATLEQAMQDLDMAVAAKACQPIANWLNEAPDRVPPMVDT